MLPLTKRLGLVALAGAALALLAPAAQAQRRFPVPLPAQARCGPLIGQVPNSQLFVNPAFRIGPNFTPINQAAFNVALMGQAYQNVPPWLFGYNPYPSPIYTPYTPYYTCYGYCGYGGYNYLYGYGGYGGYGGASSYYSSPYYGYYPSGLYGVADVINAQGKFAVNIQQANVTREQYHQMQVDTRRRIYEEWKYEQQDQKTLEQIRREAQQQAYARAVNNPTLIEVWDGDALNKILDHAIKAQAKGMAGPTVKLDDDALAKVNFSFGTGGNIGLLRNSGQLEWPAVLQERDFDHDRVDVQRLLKDAVDQVKRENGRVDAGTINRLTKVLGEMNSKLTARVGELPPDQYMEAKRYLNNLQAARQALSQPDVGALLNARPDAKTVGELVKYMAKNGLRFAPASPGNEGAYKALHTQLAAYDLGTASLARQP